MLSLSAVFGFNVGAGGWQNRLDKAVNDIDASPADRLAALQSVLQKDLPDVAKDLRSAVQAIADKGLVEGQDEVLETLFPVGTIARSDIDGLQALREQLPEYAATLKPPTAEVAADAAKNLKPPTPEALSKSASSVASALSSLATDPAKQAELAEEAKNVLRSTPSGLESEYRL